MITRESVKVVATSGMKSRFRSARRQTNTPGVRAAEKFPERFFRTLSDPPESGHIRFGHDVSFTTDDSSRLIRAFRASNEMECYISENHVRPNMYDVFICLWGDGDVVQPHSMTFYFRADSSDPVLPPEWF